MKILHVADPHLGLVTHSRPDPATGLPSRLLDVARSWHRTMELAVEDGVDLVVVAGDSFHGRNPDAASLNFFAQGLRQVTDIPVVLVAGNHDGAQQPGRQSVLEIFHDPPHVYVSTRPEVLDVDGIRVATLPWVSRQGLLAAHPELPPETAGERFLEGLLRVLGWLRNEKADVLTGHWSVQGAVLGAERDLDISITGEHVIPLAELEDGPWSYVALGHIHKRQRLGATDSRIWYAGSLERVSFGEEADDKGPITVELFEGGGMKVHKHTLAARRFVTYRPTDPALPGLEDEDLEEAIVRVQLELTEEQASEIDKAAIMRRFADKGVHQVRLEVDVQREVRARAEKVTAAIGPLEALDEFLAAKDVPEDRRPDVRDAAKKLLEDDA